MKPSTAPAFGGWQLAETTAGFTEKRLLRVEGVPRLIRVEPPKRKPRRWKEISFGGQELDLSLAVCTPCARHVGAAWRCGRKTHRLAFLVQPLLGCWPSIPLGVED